MSIQVVILAAGKGKRMVSDLPKVLHRIAGKTMLEHVIATAKTLSPLPPIVIYGHQGEVLKNALSQQTLFWVEQKEQLGTGHAVAQALSQINPQDQILILCGDVPLISSATLNALIEASHPESLSMVTATLSNPFGYGRIKRDDKQQIKGIVEEKDATPKEQAITEINPGIYLVPGKLLHDWLPKLQNKNAQGEYYLTDIISLAADAGIPIHSVTAKNAEEIQGVNDRVQLSVLERFYQKQIAESLLRQGVNLADPSRLDIRGKAQIGKDVYIDINVILEGEVIIGDQCVIGPNVLLRDCKIGNQVEIKANSVLEKTQVGDACVIGPFARLRPGTVLAENVHIGNFVEVKNSAVGHKSKINHLSYIGDAEIGKSVNVGAGTITCNYDGVNKHRTIIEDGAFIGSCTQLVAPVIIEEGATIGAGSTIVTDAPAYQLTLARSKQVTIPDWVRPLKIKDTN